MASDATPDLTRPVALIWHLALTADWAAATALGRYAVSTRGLTLERVGFIHCSYGRQVAGVAAQFYADETAPLTLLGIDTGRLAAAGIEVRAEPGDPAHLEGERFPHVYGAIPLGAVVETHGARIREGELLAPTWMGRP
ncbi:MAG: DUF952 domain-containing protein [Candidatus Limnocylindrales bacterium]